MIFAERVGGTHQESGQTTRPIALEAERREDLEIEAGAEEAEITAVDQNLNAL